MTYAPKFPGIKEIVNTIVSDFKVRINSAFELLKKSVVKAFAWAFAGCNMLIWKYLSWQFLQVYPQTASLDALKRWGYIVGVDYKYGENTVLSITVENVTASYILTGTVYKHLVSGNIYTVLSTSTPVNGVCRLNVSALKTGSQGNINIGESLELTSPLEGIPSKAVVSGIVVEGSEDEEIEAYRSRVLSRFRRKPQGGSFQDYRDWAMEVSGIKDALPYCLTEGTVSIFLVAEGSGRLRTPTGSVTPNPFPEWENGQMKMLSGNGNFYNAAMSINGTGDMLNTRRPATSTVQLLPPNYVGFKVIITGLTPNNNDIIASIKKAVIEYLDEKFPNIPAIGYMEQDALINTNELNAIVQAVVKEYSGSYTSFKLVNGSDEEINMYYLGVGELACLDKLTINGSEIDCNVNSDI